VVTGSQVVSIPEPVRTTALEKDVAELAAMILSREIHRELESFRTPRRRQVGCTERAAQSSPFESILQTERPASFETGSAVTDMHSTKIYPCKVISGVSYSAHPPRLAYKPTKS
jgi:hypothetical protein